MFGITLRHLHEIVTWWLIQKPIIAFPIVNAFPFDLGSIPYLAASQISLNAAKNKLEGYLQHTECLPEPGIP